MHAQGQFPQAQLVLTVASAPTREAALHTKVAPTDESISTPDASLHRWVTT